MQSNQLCYRITFIAFFFFSCLTACFNACHADEPQTEQSENKIVLLQAEAEAPINTLREAVSNAEMTFPEKGKWNIIFYWSLFCHSCLQEIPAVKKRLKDDDDFSVFFVSLDSEQMQTGLKNFSLKRKLGKPLLMEKLIDSKYSTADQWGVVTTPTVFIVSPEGKVAFSHAGPLDIENFFESFENLRKKAVKNNE